MTYIVVLLVNVILLFVYKSERRFWVLPISLWVLIVLSFVFWRLYMERKNTEFEKKYRNSAAQNLQKDTTQSSSGDFRIWNEWSEMKEIFKENNSVFLNTILLQTFFTYLAQVVGYKFTTSKRIYKWTKTLFGILFLICFWFAIMLAIVPSAPLV